MTSTEASLTMTASSVASQSELADIRLEYWLKRLNGSSPLAVSCDGSVLSAWLLCVKLLVSMTLFTTTSCDLGKSDGVFNFFCKVYFLPILLRKHFVI